MPTARLPTTVWATYMEQVWICRGWEGKSLCSEVQVKHVWTCQGVGGSLYGEGSPCMLLGNLTCEQNDWTTDIGRHIWNRFEYVGAGRGKSLCSEVQVEHVWTFQGVGGSLYGEGSPCMLLGNLPCEQNDWKTDTTENITFRTPLADGKNASSPEGKGILRKALGSSKILIQGSRYSPDKRRCSENCSGLRPRKRLQMVSAAAEEVFGGEAWTKSCEYITWSLNFTMIPAPRYEIWTSLSGECL